MPIRVLIAARSKASRQRIEKALARPGVLLLPPVRDTPIWAPLSSADADVVVAEQSILPASVAPWIASLRDLPERPEVIILSGREDPSERASLLAAGALAVLHERLTDEELENTLAALVSRRRAQEHRTIEPRDVIERSRLSDFESRSHVMQSFMAVARRVVHSQSSLLITGETGVGKERVARAVHLEGPRASRPFIPLNCGALPESLLEAELFGHEQGAFTGASRSRRGYFELADGGTLFLDEIGELPIHLQVKLLRVLEDRHVRRVGGEQEIPIDVRVMAATNRQLEDEVAAKRFRADLYYRLAVVSLAIPPLRERREDIPDLVDSYLGYFRGMAGRHEISIAASALDALLAYDWPGNVRELINAIERAVLLCNSQSIELHDLPPVIAGSTEGVLPAGQLFDLALLDVPLQKGRRTITAAFERAYLDHQLKMTRGRVGEAADRAQIDVRSMYNLMRKHRIRKDSYRSPTASRRRR